MSAGVALERLSRRVVNSLGYLQKDNKITLISLLISFWHDVLSLAVEYEDFAIKTAAEFASNHNSDSPWKTQEFGLHLKKMHDKRYKTSPKSIDEIGFENGFILMPFLMTMRLEAWFDAKMYNVNCALQLMIRFESAYIPTSRQKFASVPPMSENVAMEFLLRRIWHAILSCYSMVYNNSFAFCIQSLVESGYVVTWRDYCVKDVFTIAGSLMKSTDLSPGKRKVAHNNGKFEETTWIMLSLVNQTSKANRLVHFTLTQNNLSNEIYLKMYLPFTVLSPYPLLDDEFIQTIDKKDSFAEYLVSNQIEPIVVKCAILWREADQSKRAQSNHRVDKLCEISHIVRRMHDLFTCLLSAPDLVTSLQKQMRENIDKAKAVSHKNSERFLIYEKETRKRVQEDCLIIAHIRDNSEAMFSLLNAISKIKKLL